MTDSSESDAVVVPAIGVASSVAAIRSLGRAGLSTIAATDQSLSPASSSKYCTETVSVPSPSESLDRYRETLLDLAAREDVKAILPLREADVYLLSRYCSEFSEFIEPTWPAFDTLQRAQNRYTLLSIAERLGIPIPESQLLTEWPEETDPYIVKSNYSIVVDEEHSTATYHDVQTIHPESDFPDVDAVVEQMNHVPLVQEFVPNGGEYGFFALYDRGEPVVTFQHERVRSSTYTGGHSVYRKAVDVPVLDRYGRKLLDELEWHGPAMVEFRRDKRDGTYKLMEINPRFWGSLALPIQAGVDFPYLYYRLATDGFPQCPTDYKTGVGSHIVIGELGYLLTVYAGDGYEEPPRFGTEIRSVIRSLYEQPTFDYLSRDDPRPFIVEMQHLGRELFSSVTDQFS